MALAPCPTCSRHVRISEAGCPFCGGALGVVVRIERPQPRLRLGRAAIFAFGSAAAASTAGCYEHHLRGAPPDPPRDAGVEASIGLLYGTPPDLPDADVDAGSIDSLYGGPPPMIDAGTDAAFAGMYGAPPPPVDAGETISPAYGGPWPFPEEDAGTEEDAGGFVDLYGGPPAP